MSRRIPRCGCCLTPLKAWGLCDSCERLSPDERARLIEDARAADAQDRAEGLS